MPDFSLAGKYILITGASSGIGRAAPADNRSIIGYFFVILLDLKVIQSESLNEPSESS